MPQVIPGNINNSNNNPPAPQDNSWGNNDWGWGAPVGPASNGPAQKRLTPQERVEMIEKVYQDILGRKPDTRDINYYKYSTLSEEEIGKQLLTGKEHKQLLEDGRDYKKMKERALNAETRIRMLESQIKDQVEEFRHLTELLDEKNRYIQKLRTDLNNPYSFVNPVQSVQKPVENRSEMLPGSDAVASPRPEKLSTSTVFGAPNSAEPKKSAVKENPLIKLLKGFLPD